jgi:DNA-binding PadR family transcriptional regulator
MSPARRETREPAELLPLTPIVLHILLVLSHGERHGYAIAQEVERDTAGQLKVGPGTLYGSIQRMLRSGLIEETARRDSEDDPRRRYYRITPFGRRTQALELDRLADVVRVARDRRVLRES